MPTVTDKLAQLRQFTDGDPGQFLKTQMKQNLGSIQNSLNQLGPGGTNFILSEQNGTINFVSTSEKTTGFTVNITGQTGLPIMIGLAPFKASAAGATMMQMLTSSSGVAKLFVKRSDGTYVASFFFTDQNYHQLFSFIDFSPVAGNNSYDLVGITSDATTSINLNNCQFFAYEMRQETKWDGLITLVRDSKMRSQIL